MNIIINQDQSFRGFTEEDNFDLTTIEGGTTCSIVNIGQVEFEQLMIDLHTNSMVWNGSQFVESSDVEYLKAKRILEANEHFATKELFFFNENICWISKDRLRDLFIDIQIQKQDEDINGTNACNGTINIEDMSIGQIENINTLIGDEIVQKLRCYIRNIESVLKSHINNISLLNDSNDISNYSIESNYPPLVSINSGV